MGKLEARQYIADETREHLDRLAKKAIQAMTLNVGGQENENVGNENVDNPNLHGRKHNDNTFVGDGQEELNANIDKEELKNKDTDAPDEDAKKRTKTPQFDCGGKPSFWKEKRNSEYFYGR